MEKQERRYMQNRELSWLRFNESVLEQAINQQVPLLERMKFLEIFISNLDEFFMIRVGTLYNMKNIRPQYIDNKSGMNIKDEIGAILEKTRQLYVLKDEAQNELYHELKKEGIDELAWNDLSIDELAYIKKYFKSYVKPIISPQIIDKHHPFPYLYNKQLHYIAFLEINKKKRFAVIPIPKALPKVIFLKGKGLKYIRLEEVIMKFAPSIFSGAHIIEENIIRATRNKDINFDTEPQIYHDYGRDITDNDLDFRHEMKGLLHKRKRLAIVRLEYMNEISEELSTYLVRKLKIKKNQILGSKTAIGQKGFEEIIGQINAEQKELLLYQPYTARNTKGISTIESITSQVMKKDILISYPYESMEPFLRLLKESSQDKSVLSIKITIYRLSSHPKLIDYLCQASENGIAVTVLIELRARFDEENNIYWSERLEAAGCNVCYGMERYKVHSKICLITRKDGDEFTYITQVGTGNYNESTAKIYTDLSLITSNKDIGLDGVAFFQNMGMGNLKGDYNHLLVGPYNMKEKIIEYIDEQTALGEEGYIGVKINGLADEVIMEKLRDASIAGVEIKLCVRGICCLLPGVNNETDNITIKSVVGRFLEHSRIYIFGRDDAQKVYISSADWMHRNTNRRVEVAIPIYDELVKEKVLNSFYLSLNDTVNSKLMKANGTMDKVNEITRKIDSHKEMIRL